MNTKITIILVVIAVVLAVTNPSEEQYAAKVRSTLNLRNQSVAAFWLNPALSAATIRTNLVFCSLYRTELGGQTYISLGILGNFVLLSP